MVLKTSFPLPRGRLAAFLVGVLGAAVVAVVVAACAESDGRRGSDGEAISAVVRSVEEITATADPAGSAVAELTVLGWQGEEQLWNEDILPAFEAANPTIDVTYIARPALGFRDEVADQLADGTSEFDVVGCFGFDWPQAVFERGGLIELSGIEGLDNFSAQNRAPWASLAGDAQYCVPGISNLTGFLYNREIFDELGLAPPAAVDEFMSVLEAIDRDGRFIPLAFGLKDQWPASALVYDNIGPTYWQGERGRLGLIAGTSRFTDDEFVEPFKFMASWRPYLPPDAIDLGRNEAQHLLFDGHAAIAPAGSWEIGTANELADSKIGSFPPPMKQGGECYVTEQPDLGFGINPSSTNAPAAIRFVEWVATKEFAEVYTNAYPGTYTLQRMQPPIDDALAAEVGAWRQDCKTTARLVTQVLSRRNVEMTGELAKMANAVMRGEVSPIEAGEHLQSLLE